MRYTSACVYVLTDKHHTHTDIHAHTNTQTLTHKHKYARDMTLIYESHMSHMIYVLYLSVYISYDPYV